MLVVGCARAIRRSHLDEPCARTRKHVGDPEAVSDLDQLAARHDDFACLGERSEREEDSRGVVVDDERGFGPGQALEQRPEVILARSPLAAREVVLEVGVATADLGHPRERGLRERRSTEVRMDEHARRVQHATQRRRTRAAELLENHVHERLGIVPGGDLLARPCQC